MQHGGRWRAWTLWWITHALVGGSGRVIFDVAFPFIAAPEEVPGLLALGTVATVIGKVVCGPLCTALGAYRVAICALAGSAVLLLGVGLGDAAPLLPIGVAWPAFRALQTITWPSANSVCVAWFDRGEHGSAWGVMSTASRSGILVATALISLSAADMASRVCFRVTGGAVALYAVAMAILFEERPSHSSGDVQRSRPPLVHMTTSMARAHAHDHAPAAAKPLIGSTPPEAPRETPREEAAPRAWLCAQLGRAAATPVLWLALLSQGTATPIAEFQSVLPLLLAADHSLDASALAGGVMCWHVGVLGSVLLCGALLDRASHMAQRAALVVPLTCLTAALFLGAAHVGIGEGSRWLGGVAKLPLALALGASAAPTIYLVSATTVTRHAGDGLAPTLSALCDMTGYTGNVLLLAVGPGADGVTGAPMLRATGLYALCNACTVAALYVLEALAERRRASQLAEPLMGADR